MKQVYLEWGSDGEAGLLMPFCVGCLVQQCYANIDLVAKRTVFPEVSIPGAHIWFVPVLKWEGHHFLFSKCYIYFSSKLREEEAVLLLSEH